MLRFFPYEEFKEVQFNLGYASQLRYALSNYGRLVSFSDKIENGRLLKGSLVSGFRSLAFYRRDENGKKKFARVLLYKLVAINFLPQPSPEKCHVIHLDHNLANDFVGNLKWVDEKEMLEHRNTNPRVIEGRKKSSFATLKRDGHKLTSTQVMLLKKQINDPNRKTRLKVLAKRFNISEMQLYRIKRGENWGSVK